MAPRDELTGAAAALDWHPKEGLPRETVTVVTTRLPFLRAGRFSWRPEYVIYPRPLVPAFESMARWALKLRGGGHGECSPPRLGSAGVDGKGPNGLPAPGRIERVMQGSSYMTARLFSLPIALYCALALAPAQARALAGPTQAIKRTNQRINKLLKVPAPKGTSKALQVDQKLTRTIGEFLDFEELSKRSLGRHWAKRSAAERKAFTAILRQLIEHNYLKQMRSNLKYSVEYRKEERSGETARVVTAFTVTNDGRRQEVLVEYKMHRVKGGWMVYDVLTDDSSIVLNYRSQFNRIIKRKSYEALVEKMQKKLAKLKRQAS